MITTAITGFVCGAAGVTAGMIFWSRRINPLLDDLREVVRSPHWQEIRDLLRSPELGKFLLAYREFEYKETATETMKPVPKPDKMEGVLPVEPPPPRRGKHAKQNQKREPARTGRL